MPVIFMLAALSDIQLKGAIVKGLRQHGVDVERSQDRGLCGADDETVLATATAEGRIVLTNDTDYIRISFAWQAAGRNHAGIVYWHQQKYTVGEAIRRVLAYARNTAPADAANNLHYL